MRIFYLFLHWSARRHTINVTRALTVLVDQHRHIWSRGCVCLTLNHTILLFSSDVYFCCYSDTYSLRDTCATKYRSLLICFPNICHWAMYYTLWVIVMLHSELWFPSQWTAFWHYESNTKSIYSLIFFWCWIKEKRLNNAYYIVNWEF